MARIPAFRPGDLTRGLILPFRGMSYLLRNGGLKRFAVLPLLLNILLYAGALAVFFYFLWNWQIGEVEWVFWGPVGGWLARAVNWMGWMVKLVVAMLALTASFFTFTAVGMVIGSPLNDLLSEKVEMCFTGQKEKLDLPFKFTAQATMLSVYDSLRNALKQLMFTLLTLPFLLVPLVGFVPMFVVGGYFAGFGYLDASMARNFLRPPQKKLFSNKRFWELIGFGIAMQALFAIPLLGMLLMPVGVVAGTLLYCSEDWDALLAQAGMERPRGFKPPGRSNPESTQPQLAEQTTRTDQKQ